MRASRTLQRLAALITAGLMMVLSSAAHAQAPDRAPSQGQATPRAAMAPDWWACVEAAQDVEALHQIPDHLLTAIALTETGRSTPNRSIAPWPWTINMGGHGYRYATKDQAIAAAREFLNNGIRSFDVGCMQINMRYHPRAFTSFEEAFDPLSNIMYAADFISRLRANHGSWERSVQLYHSYNEEFNQIYGERVQGFWSMARRRAERGDILMLARAEDVPLAPVGSADGVALPDGFGPRDISREDSLLARASMIGMRLARAVDQTRASTPDNLSQIAPMAVALMQSAEVPLTFGAVLPASYDTTRGPAIRRRLVLGADAPLPDNEPTL